MGINIKAVDLKNVVQAYGGEDQALNRTEFAAASKDLRVKGLVHTADQLDQFLGSAYIIGDYNYDDSLSLGEVDLVDGEFRQDGAISSHEHHIASSHAAWNKNHINVAIMKDVINTYGGEDKALNKTEFEQASTDLQEKASNRMASILTRFTTVQPGIIIGDFNDDKSVSIGEIDLMDDKGQATSQDEGVIDGGDFTSSGHATPGADTHKIWAAHDRYADMY